MRFKKKMQMLYGKLATIYISDLLEFLTTFKALKQFTSDKEIFENEFLKDIFLRLRVLLGAYFRIAKEHFGRNVRNGIVKAGPAIQVVGQASSIYKQG
ncbi:unnamed protein product [Leptidea sinapis]|uniref:Uncharacterized protein n=1 Tax=Leptidea sinapis TaxID=189913 RepID=A0A5E4Q7H1_9NEOP|nr:unnamed protein product [Leptidea sinapis]